jgi:hypothetical protein
VGVGMFVIARIPYEREHVALLSREWHIRCGGLDSPTRCDVITIEELYVWRGFDRFNRFNRFNRFIKTEERER